MSVSNILLNVHIIIITIILLCIKKLQNIHTNGISKTAATKPLRKQNELQITNHRNETIHESISCLINNAIKLSSGSKSRQ